MHEHLNTFTLTKDLHAKGEIHDINGYNPSGMTPVQVAIQAGDVEAVRKIVSNPRYNPNKHSKHGYDNDFYLDLYMVYAGVGPQDPVCREIKALLNHGAPRNPWGDRPETVHDWHGKLDSWREGRRTDASLLLGAA